MNEWWFLCRKPLPSREISFIAQNVKVKESNQNQVKLCFGICFQFRSRMRDSVFKASIKIHCFWCPHWKCANFLGDCIISFEQSVRSEIKRNPYLLSPQLQTHVSSFLLTYPLGRLKDLSNLVCSKQSSQSVPLKPVPPTIFPSLLMTISQATGLGVIPESSFWLPLIGSHPLPVTQQQHIKTASK